MRSTKDQGVKRMNLNVPLNLHDAFKAATASQGKKMTDVLMKFIEQYVKSAKKHSPGELQRGGQR
jgi:ParG